MWTETTIQFHDKIGKNIAALDYPILGSVRFTAAILIPFGGLNNMIRNFMEATFGIAIGLLIRLVGQFLS
ncbi:MAG: hypothetical protein ACQZ3M_03885 [cyanobacterium endosymbiont of Rhopalodia fuxianensis]